MDEFIEVIDRLLASEDSTGCSHDSIDDPYACPLTVVSKNNIDELRELVKHYKLGS